MPDRAEIESFWDAAHAEADPRYRSDSRWDYVAVHLGHVGFVLGGLEAPCLEIGPGRGHLFRALPRPRYALEVSPLNLGLISKDADGVWSPYDDPQALGCRDAVCFLVVQHCEDDMVKRLFGWAATALAPGGRLWLQTAEWLKKPIGDRPVMQGGGARDPALIYGWLTEAGLVVEEVKALDLANNKVSRWHAWRAVKP